jgi:hypothetical protein
MLLGWQRSMLASLGAAFLALLWSLAGCACRPHAQSIDRPYAVPAPRPALRLALGGDVMFGRVTADGWREHGGREPFGAWAAALQAADVAFVNLEMGVCEQGRTESLLPLLWAPARSLQALSNAGIDAVSVANNHALDCGEDGLKRTLTARARHRRRWRRAHRLGRRRQRRCLRGSDIRAPATLERGDPSRVAADG